MHEQDCVAAYQAKGQGKKVSIGASIDTGKQHSQLKKKDVWSWQNYFYIVNLWSKQVIIDFILVNLFQVFPQKWHIPSNVKYSSRLKSSRLRRLNKTQQYCCIMFNFLTLKCDIHQTAVASATEFCLSHQIQKEKVLKYYRHVAY